MRAQRFLLYALDELAMAALRMRIRVRGEAVKPHEAHFKLHEEEVPVKNKVQRCGRCSYHSAITGQLRWRKALEWAS